MSRFSRVGSSLVRFLWLPILAGVFLSCSSEQRSDDRGDRNGAGQDAGQNVGQDAGRNAGQDAGQNAATDDAAANTLALYRLRNEAKLQADRYSEEGYARGAALFEQVLGLPGASWIDHLGKARCLVFTSDFPGAGPALEATRRLRPSSEPLVELEYVEGLFQKRVGDHETARARFARVTEMRPNLLQAWYQKGFAEERLRDWEAARASYERALQIDPKFRAAAYRLVIVLRQAGDKEREEQAFERFNSMSEEGQPDPEKCWLSMVSLIPAERREVEPKPVDLSWHEVTTDWIGEGSTFRAAWAAPAASGSGAGLVLVGETLQFLDAGSGSTQLREVPGSESLGMIAAGRIADLDNDGAGDLVASLGADGEDGLKVLWGDAAATPGPAFEPSSDPAASTPGLDSVTTPDMIELFDIDHDGDLDLIGAFSRAGGPVEVSWMRNDGDRSFTPMPALSGPDGSAVRVGLTRTGRAAFDAHDFDQGNDLDVVVAGGRVPLALLNLRDGTFRPLADTALGAQDWVRAEDLNNDGAPDLLGLRNVEDGSATWTVAYNADTVGRLGEANWRGPSHGSLAARVRDVILEDVDNDGDLDAVLASSEGVTWLRNSGGVFTVAETWPTEAGVEAVLAPDLNGDGQVEIVASGTGGVHILAAQNPTPYAAWVARPEGGRDNSDAIGVVADQFAGPLYQSRMIKRPGGVRFGLGIASVGQVDGLRLRWPQGIVQPEDRTELVFSGETGPPVAEMQQDEGLVASCPFLYAEGPAGWSFLTDVVGIAPLDEWLPEGATPHLDPEEYVRIEDAALAVRDGRLRLAITEELRETTYLDRVELVSVEHEPDQTLFLDESSNQGAYDPLRLLVFDSTQLWPAAEVRFDDGTNATELVAQADRSYAHAYPEAPSQWSGWVDRYGIRMVAPRGASTILLTGRIGWYDSTVSYALAQHGRDWGPLRLVRRADDQILARDLGFPAGMDRTMVSSWPQALTRDTELVLSGHHRFLWDRILFAPAPRIVELDAAVSTAASDTAEGAAATDGEAASPDLRVQVLPLVRADLRFHGYSAMVGDRPAHEQTYVYEEARADDSFLPAFGTATRYGDVLPLLSAHDDALVVIVAGDKVELDFEAPPEQAQGRARTYFLRISGWAKEGSYHNATGRWIEPLPFRAMSTYPPPRGEARNDAEYREYLQSYQTRETVPGRFTRTPAE